MARKQITKMVDSSVALKPGVYLQERPKSSLSNAAFTTLPAGLVPQEMASMATSTDVVSVKAEGPSIVTVTAQQTSTPQSPSVEFSVDHAVEKYEARAAPDAMGFWKKKKKVDNFFEPKLRLEIRDLRHEGAIAFLGAVDLTPCFDKAVCNVQRLLYVEPSCPTTTLPTTRSVTLILRDMGGVAYTTGSDLDDDHKEIHLSMSYVAGVAPDRCTDEITGILTHELVHCYQYFAHGTCPGGLVEGVADWVRLRCHLSPPHWKQKTDGEWDQGYAGTAYFLDYLEERFGDGTVRRVNEKLRLQKYEEKRFWTELVGRPVQDLWQDYCKDFEKTKDKKSNGLDEPDE